VFRDSASPVPIKGRPLPISVRSRSNILLPMKSRGCNRRGPGVTEPILMPLIALRCWDSAVAGRFISTLKVKTEYRKRLETCRRCECCRLPIHRTVVQPQAGALIPRLPDAVDAGLIAQRRTAVPAACPKVSVSHLARGHAVIRSIAGLHAPTISYLKHLDRQKGPADLLTRWASSVSNRLSGVGSTLANSSSDGRSAPCAGRPPWRFTWPSFLRRP
jgi:hypothetical protein